MKKRIQRCGMALLLVVLLSLSTAYAGDAIVVGYQFAYNQAGVVHLYDEEGATIVGTIGNGARLAVTNQQQEGRTYVQFGMTAGWINDGDLYEQLPQTVTGETSGSSAPATQLTPVVTQAPATEPEAEADEAPAAEEAIQENLTDEKDHEPIDAMYEPEEIGALSQAVEVVQLGAAISVIRTEEGRQRVPTAALTFADDLPREQQVGYVHAPRTGQASLRETPAKNGKILTQAKAGQLVAVLAIEEDYAHVSLQGQEGYLRLDCLRYLVATEAGIVAENSLKQAASETVEPEEDASTETQAPAAGPEETDDDVVISINGAEQTEALLSFPAEALLSAKGETDGKTSVNLRNTPDKESRKAAVWRTGVAVTVLSYQDGWYLVEADGLCGYVMEDFLTLEG